MEAVARFVENGGDIRRVLVLTASRTTAARIRDRLAERIDRTSAGPLARSVASLAHLIVGEHSMRTHRQPPVLLSGGDEDALWRQLLADDAASADGIVWPEPIDSGVRALPEFRAELREFVARLTERGENPASFAIRASETPEHAALWGALAQAWGQFEGRITPAAGGPPTVTLSTIVGEATQIAHESTAPLYDLIVADDLQEFTAGALALVLSLTGSEVEADLRQRSRASVLLFAATDTTAGSFRGATPDIVHDPRLRNFDRNELTHQHRFGSAIADYYSTVVRKIGVVGSAAERKFVLDREVPSTASAVTVGSAAEQTRLIAATLRERHLVDGVPWSDLAVAVRTSGLAGRLADDLTALDVPVERAGAFPWRHSAAVRALVLLLQIGADNRAPSSGEVHELLTSPYFDLDALAWRRLRRAVRAQQARETPATASTDAGFIDHWLIAAIEAVDADHDGVLGERPEFVAPLRLGRVLQRVRGSAEQLPGVALWDAWDALGCADAWREAAISGSDASVSRVANEQLDAVLALFKRVDTYSERFPDRTTEEFLREWSSATLDDDSLVGSGVTDAVTIGTPLSLVSLEYDTVVVAGVEDTVWPNLKLRSSLLRAEYFVRGSADRQEVLQDEARLFALAISRAREQLLVVAESSDTAGPSSFIQMLEPAQAPAQQPISVAELVASARSTLTSSVDVAECERAAQILRYLADRGVQSAAPEGWYGTLEASTIEPLGSTSNKPYISPSKIESFQDCQVQWAVNNLAGESTGNPRAIGTIVHNAVEHAVTFTAIELEALVDQQWAGLEFETPWEATSQRNKISELVGKLEEYFEHIQEDNYRILPDLREAKIRVDLGGAVLTGMIDWVECSSEGIRITDLKTGSIISKADAKEHPQLKAYQLAASRAGIEGGESIAGKPVTGARLVYPKHDAVQAKSRYRDQEPMTEPELEEFATEVVAAAEAMAGASFFTNPEEHCFKSSGFTPDCKIHVTKQVTE